ncbi:glycosyltransferase family 25 protein [Runella salmonicolor]|uniref:Glycosyltransferase family 25 protein n=1 Tax=Runella salmonicolor TaxID=2950278 RepID=A0ABT1FUH2_9BACT|nr:glycosyltransferase family 25 protein [Runella salmonicolor]MCP1385401.1 glycosyltransferase family 25 protein [Runella salmonicolor]
MKSVYEFLNGYFDRVFVVTLRRATDRQEAIKQHLEGLNYELFWAVDKKDFTLADSIKSGVYDEAKAVKFNRHRHSKLSLGEIACAWSHRNLYEKIVQEGHERVLIFEDDVVPKLQMLELLLTTMNQLPEHWELVYLGFLKNEEITPKHWRKKQFYKLLATFRAYKWLTRHHVNNLYPKPYSTNLRIAGLHDCTHAYAVSKSAAEKLLKAQTPLYSRADELMTHEVIRGNLAAFICRPTFFDQEDFARGHANADSYIWS